MDTLVPVLNVWRLLFLNIHLNTRSLQYMIFQMTKYIIICIQPYPVIYRTAQSLTAQCIYCQYLEIEINRLNVLDPQGTCGVMYVDKNPADNTRVGTFVLLRRHDTFLNDTRPVKIRAVQNKRTHPFVFCLQSDQSQSLSPRKPPQWRDQSEQCISNPLLNRKQTKKWGLGG